MKSLQMIGILVLCIALVGIFLITNKDMRIRILDFMGARALTYHNANFGFEFQYPSDWMPTMASDSGDLKSIVSIVLRRNGNDGIDIHSAPKLKAEASTIDTLEANLTIIRGGKVERIRLAGQDALKLETNTELGSWIDYYLYHDNFLIDIMHFCMTGCNPNKLQKFVLDSFKFTN